MVISCDADMTAPEPSLAERRLRAALVDCEWIARMAWEDLAAVPAEVRAADREQRIQRAQNRMTRILETAGAPPETIPLRVSRR